MSGPPLLLRVLYHKLGNITLDVGAITNVAYRKRLFCLLDRDYPYEFQVEYFNPSQTTEFAYNPHTKVWYPYVITELYDTHAVRLPSEDVCKVNVQEIEKKQRQLDQLQREIHLNLPTM
jgi:hypothetical protein